MDTISLKKYIFENNKIEYILREIGCGHIQYHPNKEYYSCSNYNGDNQAAINIKNNSYLNVINWTREKEFGDNSDIITLVQYNKDISFVEAIKYIHKILELPFEFKKVKQEKEEEKESPNLIFEKMISRRKIVDVAEIQALEDKILNDYIPLLHLSWVKEGITERTRKKFGICYSYRYKRIIVPIHHWLTGELIATNARTTVENYDEFNIRKYILSSGYNKQLNLYGLYENYDSIQKAGYVVVYESEKSVLKRDSLCDSTGIALSGHSLSDEQIAILWGLNVEIVFAFDNDISIEEIWHSCEKLCRGRKVSYIKDFMGIMKEKDSPADCCNKDFNFLFDNRITYGREQQHKYQESLNKR